MLTPDEMIANAVRSVIAAGCTCTATFEWRECVDAGHAPHPSVVVVHEETCAMVMRSVARWN